MSYQKQLKDPRWQRKRLETLERDQWTCQRCLDIKATLTVHHKSYRMEEGSFIDVWDYPDQYLVTLCESCHSEEELKLLSLKKASFLALREVCNNADAIDGVLHLLEFISVSQNRRITLEDIARIHTFYCGDDNG